MKNAYETWPLYDTVLIGGDAQTFHQNAGFFTDFSSMATPSVIPFFNVRNKSVGEQYCNLDSANKLPFVYHLYSIGVDFISPLVGGSQAIESATDSARESYMYFAGEIWKHASFILKVSQDEKLVGTVSLMPSGQGITGWQTGFTTNAEDNATALQTLGNGETISGGPNSNRWKFAEPIQMPREVTFDGQLRFSEHARNALQRMVGPLNIATDGETTLKALMAQIRVTMYGMREVQQRNALHYT